MLLSAECSVLRGNGLRLAGLRGVEPSQKVGRTKSGYALATAMMSGAGAVSGILKGECTRIMRLGETEHVVEQA